MNNLVKHKNFWEMDLPKFPKHSVLGEFPLTHLFEGDFFETKYPPCNVIETPDGFHVEVAVPGWRREDLEVSVSNRILKLKGNKRETLDTETEKYHYKELSTKAFERAFTLGKDIDVEAVFLEDGLLNISLLKKEPIEPDKLVFDIE